LISSAISSWQKTGPLMNRKLRVPVSASSSRRHQVGGELHPPLVEAEHLSEGLDQLGLAQPGHADQQRVPARQQRDQRLLDDFPLAEDDAADVFACLLERVPQLFDFAGQLARLGIRPAMCVQGVGICAAHAYLQC